MQPLDLDLVLTLRLFAKTRLAFCKMWIYIIFNVKWFDVWMCCLYVTLFISFFIWPQTFLFVFERLVSEIINLSYKVTFTGKLPLYTLAVPFVALLYRHFKQMNTALILDKNLLSWDEESIFIFWKIRGDLTPQKYIWINFNEWCHYF